MKTFKEVNSPVKRLKSMQDKMSEVVNTFKKEFGNTEVFAPSGNARLALRTSWILSATKTFSRD